MLNQHFVPLTHVTTANLEAKINDMNKEVAKNYVKMQELVREFDKRIQMFKDYGGSHESDKNAAILNTMMDEHLKKDIRRMKLVGDERGIRDHVMTEAAELREEGFASKRRPAAAGDRMDVDALKEKTDSEGEQPREDLDAVGQGRLGRDICRIC